MNIDRIKSETFINHVELHDELGSTNDRALELADTDSDRRPKLVLAKLQTGGRGRGANRWWASKGALTFSVLMDTNPAQTPPNRWPQVSLTVGLAVCEAIEEFLPNQSVKLKWPNDVFLQGRKVCGALVEVPQAARNALVLGIGINVNNSLRDAPADIRERATSMCDHSHESLNLADVLISVLKRLSSRIETIGTESGLFDHWRDRCLLTGRNIRVEAGGREIAGNCLGIDDDGALLVATRDSTERCFAGVVTYFH